MNTVDSLKNLYKAMTENDWPYDPNPTDAEVIDKIAKDGTGGGGGGSDTDQIKRDLDDLKEDVTAMQNGLPDMISDEMDDKFGRAIGDNVTDWLNDHVDPVGSAVVVDDTLTIEGAAADAKKTGDEITSLKEDITQVIDSAYVTDTASGSIASFPDGADGIPVKSLTVAIEPVQDLHGYDNPWPGGGNGNLIDIGTCTASAAGNIVGTTALSQSIPAGEYTVGITSSAAVAWILTLIGSDNAEVGRFASNTANIGRQTKTVTTTGTATKVRIYVNGATTLSDIMLESGSTAHDYVPYSNICPITGWDGVTVWRTGKNLTPIMSDPAQPDLGMQTSGVGSVALQYDSSEAAYYTTTTRKTNFTAPAAGKYTISLVAKRREGGSGTYAILGNGNVFPPFASSYTDEFTRYSRTLTLSKGDKVALVLYTAIYIKEFQIELGESASDYVPYNGTSISISFGRTVYGGTLDVGTGVLTVGGAMVDLGTLDWVPENSEVSGLVRVDAMNMGMIYYSVPVCSKFKGVMPKSYTNIGEFEICFSNAELYPILRLKWSVLSGKTNTEIKAALTGVQLCYLLATPQTIQLSAQEVCTLLAQNNVFADCGDTTVEYRADTKLYIEKLTAPTEDDMVADANIVSGQYFMVGNTLYKATANIASGGAITPNVNCTRKSLPEALNEINA